MKKLSIYLTILCLITGITTANSQNAKSKFDNERLLRGYIKPTEPTTAQQLISSKSRIGIDHESELTFINSRQDNLGNTHTRYQQYYKGIEVEGATYITHEKGGKVEFANGGLIQDLNINTIPTISEIEAIQIAGSHINTTDVIVKLVIFDKKYSRNPDNYQLTYKVTDKASQISAYVHAHTGAFIGEVGCKRHIDVPATGIGTYNDTVDIINIASDGGSLFWLRDNFRNITLYDVTFPNSIVTDTDDFFDAPEVRNAVDAYWAAQKSVDYFMSNFDYHNYNGVGGEINVIVNQDGWSLNLGYWDDSTKSIILGAGDGTNRGPVTSLDIFAHEFVHGITQEIVDFPSTGQAGALSESISDFFGVVIEHEHHKDGGNWIMGEEYVIESGKNGLRNLAEPWDVTMVKQMNFLFHGDDQLSGDIYRDSGIPSFVFYSLSEGGIAYDGSLVDEIGMDKVAQIIYYALYYMTANAEFMDARIAMITAAEIIYGFNSYEAQQVGEAWWALGVGRDYGDNVSSCRERDSLALLAIYEANIDVGDIDYYWNINQPMDEWPGVELNENGCVIRLELFNFNIGQGYNVSAEIEELQDMKELRLYEANNLPSTIENLNNLELLHLYNCYDTIPSEIENLSDLKDLALIACHLYPFDVGGLEELESLDLSATGLQSLPLGIENLDKLKRLNLSRTGLNTIPSEIYNFVNLESLGLNDLNLDSIPQEIGNLTNLKWLDFGRNNIMSLSSTMMGLDSLITLKVESNNLNFDNLEALKYKVSDFHYAPQGTIPTYSQGNTFYVKAGGTLSNNIYEWYRDGNLVATIQGDSTYTPNTPGNYHCVVSNTILTNTQINFESNETPSNAPPLNDNSTFNDKKSDKILSGYKNISTYINQNKATSNIIIAPNEESQNLTLSSGFDLALTKSLTPGGPITAKPGVNMSFDIAVTNQGSVDAYNIIVNNYMASGYVFSINLNSEWGDNDADGNADYMIEGPLSPGETATFTLALPVYEHFSGTVDDLVIESEISSADDDNNPNTPPPVDIDSTPDNDPWNDDISEDDYASFSVDIFDMALDMTLAVGQSEYVVPGDTVTYRLTLYNQGTTSAYNTLVTSYVPSGMIFVQELNPSWVTDGDGDGNPDRLILGPVIPEDSYTFSLSLVVKQPFIGTSIDLINYAEIGISDNNQDWADGLPIDFDSTPDINPDNDAGGTPDGMEDDYIDGDGSGIPNDGNAATDEDDHDPAMVKIQTPNSNTSLKLVSHPLYYSDDIPVYPGDCNADGVVDWYDFLTLYLSYGNSGATRLLVSDPFWWAAQWANDWLNEVLGVNAKHQDCDGNGIVNDADTLAFDINLDSLRPVYSSQRQGLLHSNYELGFTLHSDEELEGDWRRRVYDIELRNLDNQEDVTMYGLIFSINYGGLAANGFQISANVNNSSLGNNLAFMQRYDPVNKKLEIGISRKDQNDIIVDGSIGQLIVLDQIWQGGEDILLISTSANGRSFTRGFTEGDLNIYRYNAQTVYSGGAVDYASEPITSPSIFVTQPTCDYLGEILCEAREGTNYIYEWSNGAMGSHLTNLAPGIYTVTVSESGSLPSTFELELKPPTNCPNEIRLSPTVFLEGAYDVSIGIMRDDLRVRGVIPLNSPYTRYDSIPTYILNRSDSRAIVDWVELELRDTTTSNYTAIYRRSALLRRDGKIVDVDGVSPVRLVPIGVDSYYLVIKHRNHLPVMSAQSLSIDTNAIDFTANNSYNANNTGAGQKELSGVWVMFTGDCDQISDILGYDINGSDKGLWVPDNGTFGVYLPSDMNLDGDVNGADKGVWFSNNGTSSAVPK